VGIAASARIVRRTLIAAHKNVLLKFRHTTNLQDAMSDEAVASLSEGPSDVRLGRRLLRVEIRLEFGAEV
jgi:hypothetical protein